MTMDYHPIVNDEYGCIGEPVDQSEGQPPVGTVRRCAREKHRQTLWGIAVGGGDAAAGDKNDYADGRPYFSGNWRDAAEYGANSLRLGGSPISSGDFDCYIWRIVSTVGYSNIQVSCYLGASIEVKIDESDYTPFAASFRLKSGTHSIACRVTDRAGNREETIRGAQIVPTQKIIVVVRSQK